MCETFLIRYSGKNPDRAGGSLAGSDSPGRPGAGDFGKSGGRNRHAAGGKDPFPPPATPGANRSGKAETGHTLEVAVHNELLRRRAETAYLEPVPKTQAIY